MYYLHLVKLTLDERKTLTKVSTRTTSHNHSPKQAQASDTKEQENQQTRQRASCIARGENQFPAVCRNKIKVVCKTTQILHFPHNTSANHVKFATFANNRQDKLPFLTHFAYVLLRIFCIYAHILHHCRLVLCTYDFTVETVFYVKCICMLPNTYFSYQLHPLTPITHQNQNSQCCRYARLQPVYCQLIVLTSNIWSLVKSLIGIGTVWLTPRLLVSIFRRPPAFLASY